MANSHQPHLFEVYILGDTLTVAHWTRLHKAITSHLGLFGGKYLVGIRLTDNVVRVFVSCTKDLSCLSNALEGMLLRPCRRDAFELPTAHSADHFVQFVAGGNILDLKEKMQIKKAKSLEYATFSVRAISYDKALVSIDLYFHNLAKSWSKSTKLMTTFPAALLAIDFTANTHYLKKTTPKYLNIEKSLHMLSSDNVGAVFEIDTFPYFSHNYYLNLTSYEFDKHSFIIGASGSGKSKLISLLVDRLSRTALATNYRVVVIDPHASLADDFVHLPSSKVINFSGESAQLFGGSATDISAATELTATLFKSLMSASTAKTDRLLRFSLYVLLIAQIMSLDTLKRFLTEVELRNSILDHVRSYVPVNIVHFFGADFNELRTRYYDEAVSPIISLIDEMQMQPALVGEGELSLAKTIQDNFITTFSLNKVSMGDKVVKTVAGLLIQQIFLLAQARAFGQKVILIVDEVSVVQNPALAAILAEARKFNLTVILTQQYFGQIEKDLQAAIFANVYNYYTFKVSEEDARALEGNLNIELPKELVESEHKKGLKESDVRIKIMTELHPRECLVRILANGQVVPAVKARTLDAPKIEHGRASQETELRAYPSSKTTLPEKFRENTYAAPPQSVNQPATTAKETQTTTSSNEHSAAFNLSDLLTQHSSSRLKIKRKD